MKGKRHHVAEKRWTGWESTKHERKWCEWLRISRKTKWNGIFVITPRLRLEHYGEENHVIYTWMAIIIKKSKKRREQNQKQRKPRHQKKRSIINIVVVSRLRSQNTLRLEVVVPFLVIIIVVAAMSSWLSLIWFRCLIIITFHCFISATTIICYLEWMKGWMRKKHVMCFCN